MGVSEKWSHEVSQVWEVSNTGETAKPIKQGIQEIDEKAGSKVKKEEGLKKEGLRPKEEASCKFKCRTSTTETDKTRASPKYPQEGN
ncbi:MAG: hypothetical protein HQ561_12215 [Desulfobacteraceae bacterium]|nr:hypothetical protein [Desulfobacteraceae bacterium]